MFTMRLSYRDDEDNSASPEKPAFDSEEIDEEKDEDAMREASQTDQD